MGVRQALGVKRAVVGGCTAGFAGLVIAFVPGYLGVGVNSSATEVIGFGIVIAALVHMVLGVGHVQQNSASDADHREAPDVAAVRVIDSSDLVTVAAAIESAA
jgi:hypothetical protein